MALHLVKLCVGVSSVIELFEEYTTLMKKARAGRAKFEFRHKTHAYPKRADEIVENGSLYWVIGGIIRARHRILRLDRIDRKGDNKHCAIVYDPLPILVEPWPRRAFQGWRYLESKDAPPDLPRQSQGWRMAKKEQSLPPDMAKELRHLGLL